MSVAASSGVYGSRRLPQASLVPEVAGALPFAGANRGKAGTDFVGDKPDRGAM